MSNQGFIQGKNSIFISLMRYKMELGYFTGFFFFIKLQFNLNFTTRNLPPDEVSCTENYTRIISQSILRKTYEIISFTIEMF